MTNGTRILLVEDELIVRSVLALMLRNAGYSVVEAEDGRAAVEIFRRDPDGFGCVLLDLQMPKLDGSETLAELQAIRSDVRVILNSGFTEEEMRKRFQGAGLAGFICKPAPKAVVLQTIERALMRS